jgi:hypothetical protein
MLLATPQTLAERKGSVAYAVRRAAAEGVVELAARSRAYGEIVGRSLATPA